MTFLNPYHLPSRRRRYAGLSGRQRERAKDRDALLTLQHYHRRDSAHEHRIPAPGLAAMPVHDAIQRVKQRQHLQHFASPNIVNAPGGSTLDHACRAAEFVPKSQKKYERELIDSWVEYDPVRLTTTAHVEMRVKGRKVIDVAKPSDPRTWAYQAPYFWPALYRVDHTTLDFYDPQPFENDDVPPARPWSDYLYEFFELGWGDMPMGFYRNVLAVDVERPDGVGDKDPYHMDFRLIGTIQSRLGFNSLGGGMDCDDGYTTITQEGDWVKIVAQKGVRFTDRTPNRADEGMVDMGQISNYTAPGIVGVWFHTLIWDGACAEWDFPDGTWPSPPEA